MKNYLCRLRVAYTRRTTMKLRFHIALFIGTCLISKDAYALLHSVIDTASKAAHGAVDVAENVTDPVLGRRPIVIVEEQPILYQRYPREIYKRYPREAPKIVDEEPDLEDSEELDEENE
jgi:hypothetical protein